jgi:hypothetical protein
VCLTKPPPLLASALSATLADGCCASRCSALSSVGRSDEQVAARRGHSTGGRARECPCAQPIDCAAVSYRYLLDIENWHIDGPLPPPALPMRLNVPPGGRAKITALSRALYRSRIAKHTHSRLELYKSWRCEAAAIRGTCSFSIDLLAARISRCSFEAPPLATSTQRPIRNLCAGCLGAAPAPDLLGRARGDLGAISRLSSSAAGSQSVSLLALCD